MNKHKTLEYDTIAPPGAEFFVGIDPSYSSTGFVVLNKDSDQPLYAEHFAAGKTHQSFAQRMQALSLCMFDGFKDVPKEKTFVCMEGSAFASEFNVFKLGKLSGVLEYWLGMMGYRYNLVAPTYLKKVATGKGNATKQQVLTAVARRWTYKTKCDDIADAYTLAQIARGALPPVIIKKKG